MKRRLLNLLTALSLLVCVAVVGLWVRSYVAADALARTRVRNGGGMHVREEVVWVSRDVVRLTLVDGRSRPELW